MGRTQPLLVLSLVFFVHLGVLGAYGVLNPGRMVIRGIDATGYYAYFHSLYFDRDLDFRNQYEEIGEGHVPHEETTTGRVSNVFSIGPSLALSPFFLMADAWARVSGAPADGRSRPYHVMGFVGLGFYGLAALLLMASWCRTHFGAGIGAWAALLGWGGTTLMYYSAPMDFMPHAIGAAGAALFLVACEREDSDRPVGALLVGFALGGAMLARWQNALYAVYPVVLMWERWKAAERPGRAVGRGLTWSALVTGGGVAAFSPQLAAWAVLYGTPLLVPQGEGFLRFLQPKLLPVLFSMERGLFTWTPLTAVAVAGLLFARGKAAARAAALGVIFATQLYLNSTVLDWDASWGFGMRRFTEMAPVFAFGMGALLARWDRREWRQALAGLGLLLIVWNEMFIFQYVNHLISWDAPLTWHEYAEDKFHLARSRERRLWHNEAQLQLAEGRYADALASIEEARREDPHHDDIYILEAVIHESMGDYDRAEELLLRARSLRPSNPHLDHLLSRVEGSRRGMQAVPEAGAAGGTEGIDAPAAADGGETPIRSGPSNPAGGNSGQGP